eukprot:TRINITY_DN8836_c0_g1_i1.p1 TRINITY_DN8836_c0_g1~~TRINITY_DN8836_c0_g1_i1.p1  ORF type:complete len:894 (+),score=103.18 TRINITY_DN8836_c0_g1_i1:905-3586(+)
MGGDALISSPKRIQGSASSGRTTFFRFSTTECVARDWVSLFRRSNWNRVPTRISMLLPEPNITTLPSVCCPCLPSQAAYGSMAASPQSVVQRGFDLFKQHDTDQSGVLEAHEFQAVLRQLGVTAPLDSVLADLPTRRGTVGFAAFVRWLGRNRTLFGDTRTPHTGPSVDASQLLTDAFLYFLAYDKQRSGSLSADEFECLAADLGLPATTGATFKSLDQNSSGRLEFGEFMHWFAAKFASPLSPPPKQQFLERVNAAFTLFRICDADGSGSIDKLEYERAAKSCGAALPPWSAVDRQAAGKVLVSDFLRIAMQLVTGGSLTLEEGNAHEERIVAAWNEHSRQGKLDKSAADKALEMLNLDLDRKALKKLFDAASKGHSVLDFQGFSSLVARLSESAKARDLFQKYCHAHTMTPAELSAFCAAEKTSFSLAVTRNLSLPEFQNLLLDPRFNSWFDPAHEVTYQDMSQPLTHYFIASSHNTYCSGNQLNSDSKVEMYIEALESGCRCVELDCWDGDNGEPIIYHGHTATSKIPFRSVIEAIKRAAFRASSFPVILSLEVHASRPQQAKMAQCMNQVFGASLLRPAAPGTPLSDISPLALCHRFIIKGKVNDLPPTDAAAEEGDKVAPKVAPELSECVWMRSGKADLSYRVGESQHWEVASYSEKKSLGLIKEMAVPYADANCRSFTRVFPLGVRVDSSNYDPQPHWAAGCQLVALNYQTKDFPLRLNVAKFQQNGRSGYILKPPFLRVPGRLGHCYDNAWSLTVEIISGHHIPCDEGEVTDTFVALFTTGAQADCSEEKKTGVIENNGFNPVWNARFAFNIRCPELAMLTLRVMDKDRFSRHDTLAEASIPLTSLRPGFRAVPLHSPSTNTQITGGLLFCRFDLSTAAAFGVIAP